MKNIVIVALWWCFLFTRVSEAFFASGIPWRNFIRNGLPRQIGSGDEDSGEADSPVVISGDIVTDRTQYAYLARIISSTKLDKRVGLCTGSIISSTVILTAAHCVVQPVRKLGLFDDPFKTILVTVGDLVRSNSNEGSGTNEVTVRGSATAHPNYPTTEGADGNPYDIAVIKLQSSLTFDAYIQPIALASSTYTVTDGDTASIAGWGKHQIGSSETSDNLRSGKARVFKASQNICLSSNTNHICAAPAAFGTPQHICSGDSGGPFMQVISGKKTLIGVSSYAINDCSASTPITGAIAVAPFVSWISQYTG